MGGGGGGEDGGYLGGFGLADDVALRVGRKLSVEVEGWQVEG